MGARKVAVGALAALVLVGLTVTVEERRRAADLEKSSRETKLIERALNAVSGYEPGWESFSPDELATARVAVWRDGSRKLRERQVWFDEDKKGVVMIYSFFVPPEIREPTKDEMRLGASVALVRGKIH